MARKRLSDLLREEAQKPTNSEGESSLEGETATAKATTENSGKAGSTKSASTVPVGHPSTESRPDAVTELKNALQDAEKREDELKKQVAELKTELKSQTASEKKLQTSLEKLEKRHHELETELAEAKQTALQLAEANSQLKQTLDLPKKQEAKSLQPAKQQPTSSAPLTQQEMIRRRQERSLAHPIFPTGTPPGQLSEQDLGWVD